MSIRMHISTTLFTPVIKTVKNMIRVIPLAENGMIFEIIDCVTDDSTTG